MAKFSRNQLKSLVKECLVEILEEGIGTPGAQLQESRSRRSASNQPSTHTRRRGLDNITYGSKKKVENQDFDKNVKSSVTSLTADPVLQAIFSDTARTTLQEQINDSGPSMGAEAQISMQGDSASREMIQSDPMNIFGDASQNWAALAFSDPASKN